MDEEYIRELAEHQKKEKLKREEENRKKNGKIWNMVIQFIKLVQLKLTHSIQYI